MKSLLTALDEGSSIPATPLISPDTQPLNKFLPQVFKTTSEITLVLPSVRWQTQPTIQANKTYEFIFTYVKDEWLGGVVEYV